MDRGPRTGVTGAVSASDLHLCEGWGLLLRGLRFGDRGPRSMEQGSGKVAGKVWIVDHM